MAGVVCELCCDIGADLPGDDEDTTLAAPVCLLVVAPGDRTCYSIPKSDGLGGTRGARMNRSELAERLADRTGMSKGAAKDAVDGVFETIAEALARGNEVRIQGFGTFVTRHRPARTGRNPGTGEQVEIAASTAPAFKAGKTLRDAVNTRNTG